MSITIAITVIQFLKSVFRKCDFENVCGWQLELILCYEVETFRTWWLGYYPSTVLGFLDFKKYFWCYGQKLVPKFGQILVNTLLCQNFGPNTAITKILVQCIFGTVNYPRKKNGVKILRWSHFMDRSDLALFSVPWPKNWSRKIFPVKF